MCLSVYVWSAALTLLPTRSTGPFVIFNVKHKPLITVQLTTDSWLVDEQYAISPPAGKYVLKEAQKCCSNIFALQ